MKQKRKSIILTIILVILVFLIGGGTYLFNFAIGAQPPTPTNKSGKDVVSQTFAKARDDGAAWLKKEDAETLPLTVNDGTKLQGYYLPAEKKSTKLAILVHGYRSDATMMGDYGKYYRNHGFNVFMADNRGHGKSGGKYVGMGYKDSQDYIQWINLLLKNKLPGNTKIVLHGISMGGATVATMTGSKDLPSQVKVAVDDCGYSSVKDEFGYQITQMFHLPSFPLLNIASLESKVLAGYSFEDANPSEAVKHSETPTLFIHGGEDDYNPTWMGIENYQNAPAKKDLFIVPSAEHGLSYYVDQSGYEAKLTEFIQKYF